MVVGRGGGWLAGGWAEDAVEEDLPVDGVVLQAGGVSLRLAEEVVGEGDGAAACGRLGGVACCGSS